MSCEICEYANEHGSWPSDHRGTHCEGCHRSWTGKGQSHCAGCHRHFGSHPAGDAHRVGRAGSAECVDPKGYPRFETENGPIWGGKDPEVFKAMREKAQKARRGSSDSAETEISEAA